jgi:hypothetical protein
MLRQRLNRLKRITKRRWRYIVNWLFRNNDGKSPILCNKIRHSTGSVLKCGDLVRVRSKEEIQNTLNKWNKLRGCSFMEEMWPYCGTQQRVFKRVEKFLDERDYLMKRCKSVILLEGVFCDGTKDFGPCDRSCFYFWSDEWLEKID